MVDDQVIAGFAQLLEETTGLRSPESNRTHLRRVVAREARNRDIGPDQLLSMCRTDENALQSMVDVAMIGETYFFREATHFRYLRDNVLRHIGTSGPPITAWSASCSTGEEAISLAALLNTYAPERTAGPARVLASDIRSDMLDRLRSGVYPLSSLRRDGQNFHHILTDKYTVEETQRTITISPELLQSIEPLVVNLFADNLDRIPDDIDIVFFRNTLIYAPPENRNVIIDKVANKVRPGGYLFLANSELPFVIHPDLELQESDGTYCLRKQEHRPPQSTPVGAGKTETGGSETARNGTGSSGNVSSTSGRPAALQSQANHSARSKSARSASLPSSHGQNNRDDRNDRAASASLIEILDLVDQLATDNNVPQAIRNNVDLVQTAQSVLSMFADLDRGRLDRAQRYLDTISVLQPDQPVSRYCSGWFSYCSGETDAAISAFTEALKLDHTVWPAHFYLGKLRRIDQPTQARSEFAACIRKIDQHRLDEYRFLVGGFDPKQIRALCDRWIQQIDQEQSGSSHGS